MYSLGRRLKAEAAKPRGRSPRGFAAEAFNLLPREYIEYSRKLPGAPFTMIPPRLSNRFSFFLTNARGAALGSSEFAARRKHEIVFLCRGALDKNRFVMPREYRGEYTRQKAETLTQLNRNILVRWLERMVKCPPSCRWSARVDGLRKGVYHVLSAALHATGTI